MTNLEQAKKRSNIKVQVENGYRQIENGLLKAK